MRKTLHWWAAHALRGAVSVCCLLGMLEAPPTLLPHMSGWLPIALSMQRSVRSSKEHLCCRDALCLLGWCLCAASQISCSWSCLGSLCMAMHAVLCRLNWHWEVRPVLEWHAAGVALLAWRPAPLRRALLRADGSSAALSADWTTCAPSRLQVSNPQVQQQLKQLATQQQQGMQGLNALRNTTANPQVAVAAAAAAASALNDTANDARGQGVPIYEGAGGSLPAHPLQVSRGAMLRCPHAAYNSCPGSPPELQAVTVLPCLAGSGLQVRLDLLCWRWRQPCNPQAPHAVTLACRCQLRSCWKPQQPSMASLWGAAQATCQTSCPRQYPATSTMTPSKEWASPSS